MSKNKIGLRGAFIRKKNILRIFTTYIGPNSCERQIFFPIHSKSYPFMPKNVFDIFCLELMFGVRNVCLVWSAEIKQLTSADIFL